MAKSLLQEFSKGIVKENPVLRLMLGTCATLAVTTAASNAIGMGAATTFVLVCSNAVISALCGKSFPTRCVSRPTSRSSRRLLPSFSC